VTEPVPDVPIVAATSGGNPAVTPFTLEVVQESNDGTNLEVRGRFTSKIPWKPQDVVVRLSAMDESGSTRQTHFMVPAGREPGSVLELAPEVPTEFALTLPSKGLSNYQIELLWGKDAESVSTTAKEQKKVGDEFIALRNLEEHRVPSKDCAVPSECRVTYYLTGEFFNAGSAVIDNVRLRAGFSRADDFGTSKALDDERFIEVRNLGLQPGKSRPFKLSLEKAIPAAEEMAPKPVVSIESFSSRRVS